MSDGYLASLFPSIAHRPTQNKQQDELIPDQENGGYDGDDHVNGNGATGAEGGMDDDEMHVDGGQENAVSETRYRVRSIHSGIRRRARSRGSHWRGRTSDSGATNRK